MFADALLQIAKEMDEGVYLYNKKLPQETEQIEAVILYKKDKPKKKEKQPPDARAKHPAIAAVRALIKAYPQKEVWDEVISIVGDQPDIEKMTSCFLAWCRVSSNKANLATWLFDWYMNGIPEKKGNGHYESASERNERNIRETARLMGIEPPISGAVENYPESAGLLLDAGSRER